MNRLVSGHFIAIETTLIDGRKADRYDLTPTYVHLERLLEKDSLKQEEEVQEKRHVQSINYLNKSLDGPYPLLNSNGSDSGWKRTIITRRF